MANVVYPQVDFLHNPVNHAPSRYGFGFGLPGNSSTIGVGRQPAFTPGHTQPAAFQQLTSHMNLPSSVQRVQKRRHEPEDDAESSRHGARDVPMDRSPTPERPKRAAPKRVKTMPHVDPKGDQSHKDNKASDADNDVDVGVLLASLPPQSLLPLLNALICAQPTLKSLILPLIPRPTLDTAIQALEQSARKLRGAYPYSSAPSFPSASASATTSFGFGFGSQRPAFGGSIDDYQRNSAPSDGSRMRESYILSRLRPHIHEFVSACMSYVPYFSYVSATEAVSQNQIDSSSRSHSAALQLQHKDNSHPSETFLFLSALTAHITSQPPLTQSSLAPLLLPRLSQEWVAWIDRIDQVVNREGGMFGGETVKTWEKTFDEFAEARGPEGWGIMREVRDRWVAKVGWLVGRSVLHPMEEEV
ncbi:hypothetical protein HYDPIDRAFT_106734 [Hydnomerulius pinastri MD-312]|nr:hypothetical protein HYDPIDRAFT_106734 [Hydnomerulius pinastri MD-312]